MKLLKLGDRVINLDQVTEYTLEGNDVIVHFGPSHETRFTRHDAALLRRWIDATALDVAILDYEAAWPTKHQPHAPQEDVSEIPHDRRRSSRI